MSVQPITPNKPLPLPSPIRLGQIVLQRSTATGSDASPLKAAIGQVIATGHVERLTEPQGRVLLAYVVQERFISREGILAHLREGKVDVRGWPIETLETFSAERLIGILPYQVVEAILKSRHEALMEAIKAWSESNKYSAELSTEADKRSKKESLERKKDQQVRYQRTADARLFEQYQQELKRLSAPDGLDVTNASASFWGCLNWGVVLHGMGVFFLRQPGVLGAGFRPCSIESCRPPDGRPDAFPPPCPYLDKHVAF